MRLRRFSKRADRTSTHLFAGGGGDAHGFALAGYGIAAARNHSEICTDTLGANFPDADIKCVDLHADDLELDDDIGTAEMMRARADLIDAELAKAIAETESEEQEPTG